MTTTDTGAFLVEGDDNVYDKAHDILDDTEDANQAFILIAPSRHPETGEEGTTILTPVMDNALLVAALETALRHARSLP